MAYGETAELRIIRRWSTHSKAAKKAKLLVKTPPFAVLDFLALDSQGIPVAFLEVKRRRTALLKYGDAICPWKKHTAAKRLVARFQLPVLLVTEYGCGSLIEVDLAAQPSQKKLVTRRDRPNDRPVAHALYDFDRLTVLEKES